jgi:hypothetical protein
MALRNTAHKIVSGDYSSEELTFISGFDEQVSYYSKVLYFLKNSLINGCN